MDANALRATVESDGTTRLSGPDQARRRGRDPPSAAVSIPVEPGAWRLARPVRRRLIGVITGARAGSHPARGLGPIPMFDPMADFMRPRVGDGETPCSIVRVRAVLVEGVRIPAGGSGPMRSAQPGPAWGAPVRATGGTGL